MHKLASRYRAFAPLLVLLALACPAVAGDVASEFGLGTVPTYPDERQAQSKCGGDAVVWVDRRTGFYYPKFAPEYGVSPSGSFTCYKQAKRADYWGFGPSAEMEGRGRVFPIVPGPSCDYRIDKATGKGFCAEPGV